MAGRKTKYNKIYCEQVEKLCKLGLIDTELAEYFGVSEKTLNTWKSRYPEFLQSIKRGKALADANVAEKLYQRATGYSHPDVDIKAYEGNIIETPVIKHYPPDTVAAIFWLKNRQKKNWRDKQVVEHELPPDLPMPTVNVYTGGPPLASSESEIEQ